MWKPLELITVDFKLHVLKEGEGVWFQLQKLSNGELVPHDFITDRMSRLSKLNNGQVVRCYWDPQGHTIVPSMGDDSGKTREFKGGWAFKNVVSRDVPNEDWMISKAVESIEQHISKFDLIKCVTTDDPLGKEFKLMLSRLNQRSKGKYQRFKRGNGSEQQEGEQISPEQASLEADNSRYSHQTSAYSDIASLKNGEHEFEN